VVGAVVEQVYSSTFKLGLLKIQEICPLKRFMHQKCVWWPGSARPAGGACSAPPDPLAELKGRELETGGEGREGEMEEEVKVRRKGEDEDPHCVKCVDAHADLPIIRPKH